MKIIAVIMALLVVLFTFAPEVVMQVVPMGPDMFCKITAPVCRMAIAPTLVALDVPEEFIEPKPDPDDGDD